MERFSDFVTWEADVGAGTSTRTGGDHTVAPDFKRGNTDGSESGVENRNSIHRGGDST